MELIMFITILVAGVGFWLYMRHKNKPKEVKENPMMELNLAVSTLETQGKVAGNDYQVYIVSQSEYNSKTPQQIKEWMLLRFDDKTGTFSSFTASGLGLHEFTYSTSEKVVDILLLIVEETGQPVIDWFKPKPPKKYFEIEYDAESTEDQTNHILEQLNAIPNGVQGGRVEIFFPKGRIWTEGDMANNPYGRKGVFLLQNKEYWDMFGDESAQTLFYTKAPAIPYGGNVGKNILSWRRHWWFRQSKEIYIHKIGTEGSNLIDGKFIGTTPELTPEFWYLSNIGETGWDNWEYLKDENGNRISAPNDNGSIGGAPAYKSYWEQEHAWDFRDCENIVLDDCYVNGVWGDGVYVGADIKESRNIEIKNSHFRFTGRQGVAAANNVDGLIIDNINCDLGRRASVDFEPHSRGGYVRNAVVKNSKLHAVQVPIAALGNGDVSNIQILDNKFSGGNFIIAGDSDRQNPILRKNWVVKGNTRTNWFGSPMASSSFYHIENILFENNVDQVSSKQSRNSIIFDKCSGEINVKNNDFKGGLYIQSRETEDIKLEGNTPEQIIKTL